MHGRVAQPHPALGTRAATSLPTRLDHLNPLESRAANLTDKLYIADIQEGIRSRRARARFWAGVTFQLLTAHRKRPFVRSPQWLCRQARHVVRKTGAFVGANLFASL